MSTGYIGQINIYAFNFAPSNTAMCNGQQLAISQNQALFALIGTYYGGNGTSTFALPNLQGRVPKHIGQLAGGGNYQIGQAAGTEQVTLNIGNLPTHTHTFSGTLNAIQAKASAQQPMAGSLLARPADANGTDNPQIYVPAGTSGTQVALGGLSGTNSNAGSSLPVGILDPYLALNFCINLYGRFPSRN